MPAPLAASARHPQKRDFSCYAHHSSGTTRNSAVITPPESRRLSDNSEPACRQSLPSILEVIFVSGDDTPPARPAIQQCPDPPSTFHLLPRLLPHLYPDDDPESAKHASSRPVNPAFRLSPALENRAVSSHGSTFNGRHSLPTDSKGLVDVHNRTGAYTDHSPTPPTFQPNSWSYLRPVEVLLSSYSDLPR